jgi:hypothetical protein
MFYINGLIFDRYRNPRFEAFLVPRLGLIAETGVITPYMVRRTANGAVRGNGLAL